MEPPLSPDPYCQFCTRVQLPAREPSSPPIRLRAHMASLAPTWGWPGSCVDTELKDPFTTSLPWHIFISSFLANISNVA